MYQDVISNEIQIFTNWSDSYDHKYPPPIAPNPEDYVRKIGWKFYLMLVASVSVVLLVALRTATQFYEAAYLSFGSPILAWSEAFLAIIGIEGLMLILGIIRSSHNKVYSDNKVRNAVLMTVGISLIAGAAGTIEIVPNLNPTIKFWILLILSGALTLASYLAFVAGEVLGDIISEHELSFNTDTQNYEESLESWRITKDNVWKRSPEHRAIQDAKKGIPISLPAPTPPVQEPSGPSVFDQMLAYLEESQFTKETVPTARQLADHFGVSPGGTPVRARKAYLDKLS